MRPRPSRPPFSERGGRLRGVLDVLSGCYPPFVFGGPVGRDLPVFHLHEVSPASLEPRLQYLAENGYRTVTSDAVARLARDRIAPGPRTVVLCFDDAWASLWTTAGPLLRRYGFQAVVFAVPARIAESDALRPTLDEGAAPGDDDRSERPFVSWPELQALHESGIIDVQSHSWSHSMMFSDARPAAFVTPSFVNEPLLNRPRKSGGAAGDSQGPSLEFLEPGDLGAPLYARRSRLSDAWRYHEEPARRERCVAHVKANGGPAFFARPRWRSELRAVHGRAGGRFESDDERDRAVLEELDRGRSELNQRLGTNAVRHVCAPWGIGGATTRRAARHLGFETLFADHLFGRRSVRAGDDPYGLMRLHDRFIQCLPGRGRRYFHSAA